jgi:hypothetical protein
MTINHPMFGRLDLLVSTANELWRDRNNYGELAPYGAETDQVNSLTGYGKLVWPSRGAGSPESCAIYWDDARKCYHVVANSHGPCGTSFSHL